MIKICGGKRTGLSFHKNIAAIYHRLLFYILFQFPKTNKQNYPLTFRDAYIVFLEVTHVAQHADPHEHGAGAQEDATDVITCQSLSNSVFFNPDILVQIIWHNTIPSADTPVYVFSYLELDGNFEHWPSDGEDVTHDDEDVPAINKLHPVGPTHSLPMILFEEGAVLL